MQTVKGYTLLELLCSVALLTLAAALATANMSTLFSASQGQQALRELARAVELAKSSAVVQQTLVTLCRSSDGRNCQGAWQDGAIVFLDPDRDHMVDADEKIIHQLPAVAGSLRWKAFQNRQYLQFTPDGQLLNQNGSFLYCPADNDVNFADQLLINRVGRLRWARDANGDGIKEDGQGKPLTCP